MVFSALDSLFLAISFLRFATSFLRFAFLFLCAVPSGLVSLMRMMPVAVPSPRMITAESNSFFMRAENFI